MKNNKSCSFKIGLFWLENNLVLATVKQSIDDGIAWFDGYIYPTLGHWSEWDDLHQYGMLERNSSNTPKPLHQVPHGSIGYSIERDVPVIFHGNWYKRDLKSAICNAFDIPFLYTITVQDDMFNNWEDES